MPCGLTARALHARRHRAAGVCAAGRPGAARGRARAAPGHRHAGADAAPTPAPHPACSPRPCSSHATPCSGPGPPRLFLRNQVAAHHTAVQACRPAPGVSAAAQRRLVPPAVKRRQKPGGLPSLRLPPESAGWPVHGTGRADALARRGWICMRARALTRRAAAAAADARAAACMQRPRCQRPAPIPLWRARLRSRPRRPMAWRQGA